MTLGILRLWSSRKGLVMPVGCHPLHSFRDCPVSPIDWFGVGMKKGKIHRHMHTKAGIRQAGPVLMKGTDCHPEPQYVCCKQLKEEQVLLSTVGDLRTGAVSGCRHPCAGSCGCRALHTLANRSETFILKPQYECLYLNCHSAEPHLGKTVMALRRWCPWHGSAHVYNTHTIRALVNTVTENCISGGCQWRPLEKHL